MAYHRTDPCFVEHNGGVVSRPQGLLAARGSLGEPSTADTTAVGACSNVGALPVESAALLRRSMLSGAEPVPALSTGTNAITNNVGTLMQHWPPRIKLEPDTAPGIDRCRLNLQVHKTCRNTLQIYIYI